MTEYKYGDKVEITLKSFANQYGKIGMVLKRSSTHSKYIIVSVRNGIHFGILEEHLKPCKPFTREKVVFT